MADEALTLGSYLASGLFEALVAVGHFPAHVTKFGMGERDVFIVHETALG